MDRKDLWVGWTHDAMSQYRMPEEVEDADELVEDMADVAAKYADEMLEAYTTRFGEGGGRSRRRKPADDDDDDDDDSDDDDPEDD